MRDEQINIFCPHYHIKYGSSQCKGLLIFQTRRGFNSQYKCEKCGDKVGIVEGMSYDEIQYLKNNKQTTGVRYT
jgi:hypothetical protein